MEFTRHIDSLDADLYESTNYSVKIYYMGKKIFMIDVIPIKLYYPDITVTVENDGSYSIHVSFMNIFVKDSELYKVENICTNTNNFIQKELKVLLDEKIKEYYLRGKEQ